MKTEVKNLVRFCACALALASSFTSSFVVHANDDTPQELQAKLKDIERLIAEDQSEIKQTQAEAKTLANALATLKKQQTVLQLQIQQTDLTSQDIETRLQDSQILLAQNEQRTIELKEQLAGFIRKIHAADDRAFLYSVFTSRNISDVLHTADEYAQLTGGLTGVVEQSKIASAELQKQTDEFALEQEEAAKLQALRAVQQNALKESVSEQKTLLTETQGEEKAYQSELGDHKALAAQIRSRIYELLDVGTTHITFGQAVKTADWVADQTGIEPAFLLSVLSQESNLGANVGTCNRVGDPVSKNWKTIMKPDRDQKPFVAIMDALGRSPEGTPVSCPMHDKAGNQIGWGGAMGPAQFIPSTWTGYDEKITALTGNPADPWDIRDAFIAAALKLTADGAASKTDDGEWAAAMRYFSGSTNPQFRFYGDQVMARTEQYRKDIKELEN